MPARSLIAPTLGLALLAACAKSPADNPAAKLEAAAPAAAAAASSAAAEIAAPAAHQAHDMAAMTQTAAPAQPAVGAKAPPAPIKTVANFTLKDANGQTHELYRLTDKAAIVIAMHGVGCPIVLKMTPDIKAIAAKYGAKNVEFLMLNSNSQDTPDMIAAEAKDFGQTIPILKDADQKVGKALGAIRTAEMYIVQPKTWNILYHGPIDDRLSYGQEKAVATKHYLSDALDEVLAGKPVDVEQTQANGCLINWLS